MLHAKYIVLEATYLDSVELVDRLKLGRGISSKPRCTDIVSGSRCPPELINLTYSGVCSDAKVGFLYSFNSNEEATTDTELAAIAADAIHGCKIKPNELNTPAAKGIPKMLYILANKKFNRIRRTVRLDRSKQATTSKRSFYKMKKKHLLHDHKTFKIEIKYALSSEQHLPPQRQHLFRPQ